MAQNDPHGIEAAGPSGTTGSRPPRVLRARDPGRTQAAAPQSAGTATGTATEGSGVTGREQQTQPGGRITRREGWEDPLSDVLRRQPLRALPPAERRHGPALLRRRSGPGELRRPGFGGRFMPNVDVEERDGRLVVRADLPGVNVRTTSGSTSRTTRSCSRASGGGARGHARRNPPVGAELREVPPRDSAASGRERRGGRGPVRERGARESTSPCRSNRGAGAWTCSRRHRRPDLEPRDEQLRPHKALKRAAPRSPAPTSSGGSTGCTAHIRGCLWARRRCWDWPLSSRCGSRRGERRRPIHWPRSAPVTRPGAGPWSTSAKPPCNPAGLTHRWRRVRGTRQLPRTSPRPGDDGPSRSSRASRRSSPPSRDRDAGTRFLASRTPWVRRPSKATNRFGRGPTRSASSGSGTSAGFRGSGACRVTARAPPRTRFRKRTEDRRGWQSGPPARASRSSRSRWKSTWTSWVHIRESHHSTPRAPASRNTVRSERMASSRECRRPRLEVEPEGGLVRSSDPLRSQCPHPPLEPPEQRRRKRPVEHLDQPFGPRTGGQGHGSEQRQDGSGEHLGRLLRQVVQGAGLQHARSPRVSANCGWASTARSSSGVRPETPCRARALERRQRWSQRAPSGASSAAGPSLATVVSFFTAAGAPAPTQNQRGEVTRVRVDAL